MVSSLLDVTDVFFGSRKSDLRDERRAVGCGRVLVPAQHMSAAGVVIGQRVGGRIVGERIAFKKLRQIPRARERVRAGIEEMAELEVRDALGISPFVRSGFADLHQTEFASAAAHRGIESTLSPNDGFHQRGFDVVTPSGGEDCRVLPRFT